MESRALAGGGNPLQYLPKPALAELGEVDASVFNYDKTRRAGRSLLFDGAVVLREEKPLSIDRPSKPRFLPYASNTSFTRTHRTRGENS